MKKQLTATMTANDNDAEILATMKELKVYAEIMHGLDTSKDNAFLFSNGHAFFYFSGKGDTGFTHIHSTNQIEFVTMVMSE